MTTKAISKLWLWLIVVGALWGCIIKVILPGGEINWYQLRYFTTLSNILCIIYASCAIFRGRERVPPVLHGTTLMAIVVTGLIYHLLLRGLFGGFALFSRDWTADQLVHTMVPLLMVTDWLFFAPKGRFGRHHTLLWACFPLLYWGGAVLMAQTGLVFPNSNSPYPYPFIDVSILGWGTTLRNVAVITVAFFALGYLIAALDRALGRKYNRS